MVLKPSQSTSQAPENTVSMSMTTLMEMVEIRASAMVPRLGSKYMLQQSMVETALRVSVFPMTLQTATGT